MAALQTLTVNDRKATPVAHVFTPSNKDNGVGTVIESTGVPAGSPKYTISLKQMSTGRFKATVKLSVPILQTKTEDGVSSNVVVRTGYAEATFTFDPTSTEAERNDLVGMFANSFGVDKALVHDTLVKLIFVY